MTTRATNRDGDNTAVKKYVGNVSDGPIQIPEDDSTAQHESMFRNMDLPTPQLEANLKHLPDNSLRRLAIRQRNRLIGNHQDPVVNSTSREVTLDSVSRLAAARLFVATTYPKLNRNSALFNEVVAVALMSPEEQEDYFIRHPEKA